MDVKLLKAKHTWICILNAKIVNVFVFQIYMQRPVFVFVFYREKGICICISNTDVCIWPKSEKVILYMYTYKKGHSKASAWTTPRAGHSRQ